MTRGDVVRIKGCNCTGVVVGIYQNVEDEHDVMVSIIWFDVSGPKISYVPAHALTTALIDKDK